MWEVGTAGRGVSYGVRDVGIRKQTTATVTIWRHATTQQNDVERGGEVDKKEDVSEDSGEGAHHCISRVVVAVAGSLANGKWARQT